WSFNANPTSLCDPVREYVEHSVRRKAKKDNLPTSFNRLLTSCAHTKSRNLNNQHFLPQKGCPGYCWDEKAAIPVPHRCQETRNDSAHLPLLPLAQKF